MNVCVCLCVCVHVFVCMYVTNVYKIISIISISRSLQNDKWHVCIYIYDCVRACACVCAWQMVAHICLIALAAKGLIVIETTICDNQFN